MCVTCDSNWKYKTNETKGMKASKKAAGYMLPPESQWVREPGKGIRCGTCRFWSPSGSCALVSREDSVIHGEGCCNLYEIPGKPEVTRPWLFASGRDMEDLAKGLGYPLLSSTSAQVNSRASMGTARRQVELEDPESQQLVQHTQQQSASPFVLMCVML